MSGWQYSIADFKAGTVAWAIQRYIEEMAEMKRQLGPSPRYNLGVVQRMSFGALNIKKLSKADLIEFAKELRKTRSAATVGQYVGNVKSVLDWAGSAWAGYEDVSSAQIIAAKPLMKKTQLVGKSQARKRRPSNEEILKLLDWYAKPNARGKARQIRMAEIIAFALVSSRRLGEICRITHGDVDYEQKVYWVRNVKHPTRKQGNDKRFILWPELAEIIRRQPRTGTHPDERIFPFNSHSCSASYTNAKKACEIVGLRFHDNRREAISQWLKKMSPQNVRIAVSGHDTTHILEHVYDGRDSLELIREGLMQQPAA
jgi:integrase